MKLVDIAEKCDQYIKAAEAAGVEIDNGNVVDLCADQSSCEYEEGGFSLSDIRTALIVAGYGERFLEATRERL